MQKWYIAIGQYYWGRGKTIQEAKRELRKAGFTGRTWLVYEFNVPEGKEAPRVDDHGNTCYYGERFLVEGVKGGTKLSPELLSAIPIG